MNRINNIIFVLGDFLEAVYWYKDGDSSFSTLRYAGSNKFMSSAGETLVSIINTELKTHGLGDKDSIKIVLAYRPYTDYIFTINEYLNNKGYNTKLIEITALLTKSISYNTPTIVACSNGKNLFFSCDNFSADSKLLSIEGEGENPKLLNAAEIAWGFICKNYPFIEKSSVFDQIISGVRPLVDGLENDIYVSVNYEGKSYSCNIGDEDIPNVANSSSSKIFESLTKWLKDNNSDDFKSISLLLSNGLAGDPYFKGIFDQFNFKSIISISKEQEKSFIENALGNSSAPWLPDNYVSCIPSEVDVVINVIMPQDAEYLRLMQGESLLKSFNKSNSDVENKISYNVSELEPDNDYEFTLEAVKLNEKNEEQVTKLPIKVHTLNLSSCIEDINTIGNDSSYSYAEISWKKPNIGEVKLYLSKVPFDNQNKNIDLESLSTFKELNPIDNHLRIQKEFCGERFILPVRIYGSSARTGSQIPINGSACPQGVRLEVVDMTSYRICWEWGNLDAVRIKWETNIGGYEKSVDLTPIDTPDATYKITKLPPGSNELKVSICALSRTSNGGEIQSSYISERINLGLIKVEFVSVNRKKRGFLGLCRSDEYEVSIRCVNGIPESDLIIIVDENQIPMNVDNYPAVLTFAKANLHVGQLIKKVMTYKKADQKSTLNLRLIVADRNKRSSVSINPETLKIN